MISESDLRALRGGLRGPALGPADAGYDEARRVWNGNIDKHPAVIARCLSSEDVAAAIAFARARDLTVAVRGGGHSAAGFSVCEGGMMLDLSLMTAVEVDSERRQAVVEPGVLWKQLDASTQAHGLAVTGGKVGHTGVAGLTLGGGFGWLTRKHGLACDSLLGAELVTAAGEVVVASATENPDLLWALRGGGGNFGVVTRFEFGLQDVGPIIVAGLLGFRPERTSEILQAWDEFAISAPEEITLSATIHRTPKLPMLPEESRNREACIISCCSLLSYDDTLAALQPMIELGPFAQLVGPLPYCLLQTSFDADFPTGTRAFPKGHRLKRLDAQTTEIIAARCRLRPRNGTKVFIEQLDGAASRVPEASAAFPDRVSAYSINILGRLDPVERAAEVKQWTQGFWRDLKPHAAGGSYLNWLGLEEEPDRVTMSFGPDKYARLARIKRQFDPDNVFHLNANIKPA
ncbi:MAG: FAD-binding oxidoreductase [Chloroflexota bacterium]